MKPKTKDKVHQLRLFVVLQCILFLAIHENVTAQTDPVNVAVVISQRIAPYFVAAEGLTAILGAESKASVKMFELDRFLGNSRKVLAESLKPEAFDLVIAIGPDAAHFLWRHVKIQGSNCLYSMVFQPDEVLGPNQVACGISLNIPNEIQLEAISNSLPTIKRIGILYDPVYNTQFVNQAISLASNFGITIVPLRAASRQEIPLVLKDHWEDIDALWMIPDRTVISESLIEEIIKQALLNNVAVVGYNSFFYEKGATLAFVFDYRELGAQTGRLAIKIIAGEQCQKVSPVFHAWLNKGAIRQLGLHIRRPLLYPLEEGP